MKNKLHYWHYCLIKFFGTVLGLAIFLFIVWSVNEIDDHARFFCNLPMGVFIPMCLIGIPLIFAGYILAVVIIVGSIGFPMEDPNEVKE